MQFETPAFGLFLAIVLVAFWLLRTPARQNVLLVAANYIFCGWFDVRYAVVLGLVSATSFAGAQWIDRGPAGRARRVRLVACLAALAGALLVLKYGGATLETVARAVPAMGSGLVRAAAAIFVPIGLSYYVLQTAGYCIDVYRGREPERDLPTYFAYVGFFPGLVAGPIAQAAPLLPQFDAPRKLTLSAAGEGVREIVWGLFKKLVVADSLARTVDYVFARHDSLPASALAVGLAMYSFQVYADFSGYSDIAVGLGRLLGFSLPRNFDAPYFSRNVAEFWRRWHMSLSSWLRNYVYLPLGGRGSSRLSWAATTLLVFALSGLWHGMTWNFLAWGLLNGLYFMPMILTGRRPGRPDAPWIFSDLIRVISTFCLVSLSRVFFRSPDIPSALGFFRGLADASFFTVPDLNVAALGWVVVLLAVEWAHRSAAKSAVPRPLLVLARYPAYASIAYFVFVALARHDARDFLYARF